MVAAKKFDRAAGLAELREALDPLFADVQADPGDGVLLAGLVAVRADLEAIEAQQAEVDKRRPEREPRG